MPTRLTLGGLAVMLMTLAGAMVSPEPANGQDSRKQNTTVTLPMQFRGLQPAIEVMVQGQGPFLFAIDTGGSGEARVDSSLASKLNLKSVGKVQASAGNVGKPQIFEQVRLDTLGMGGVEFQNVTAMVRDYNRPGSKLPHIDGILGFGLFSKYLLTLDYASKQVRLEPGTLPEPDGNTLLPFTRKRGIPIIEMLVQEEKLPVALDTGSMGGFLLPKSVAKKLPLESEPKIVGKGKTVSGEFVIEQATLNCLIRVGGHRFTNPVVEFAEVFDTANIGNQILAESSLTFDQPNQRLRWIRKQP